MSVLNKNKISFKLSSLTVLILFSVNIHADDYFDPSLLSIGSDADTEDIDLSQFAKPGSISEGQYLMSVSINNDQSSTLNIKFTKNKIGEVVPVFTIAQLAAFGINIDSVPKFKGLATNSEIINLADYIPDSSVYVSMPKLKINLSIPQINIRNVIRGYVDPALLSDGINAFKLNYQLSGGKNWQNDAMSSAKTTNNSLFANLRGGLNLGAWRLLSQYTYSYYSSKEKNRADTQEINNDRTTTDSHFSNTYLMRDIRALSAQFMIGEGNTGGDIFDGFPFKGINLSSNDDMLASSQRGFAPVINGIAQSNARVTIRQNGNIIYQSYVAPGAFSINDIYASGNAGDLEVTITEENGVVRTFTQAYSSLPVMLRPGRTKFETTVGQYDGNITLEKQKTKFFLGTYSIGLMQNITLYGGVLIAEKYIAASMGSGFSLGGLGALSADVTHSSSKIDNLDELNGQSFRLRYSKSLLSTGTSFDLTALRYSTKNYYSFSDFNNSGYQLKEGISPWLDYRQRSSFQTSISQSLGDWGSLYLNASIHDYWNNSKKMKSLSAGYNTYFKGVNYNINYSIDRISEINNSWPENRMISVNIRVPFSLFSNNPTLQNMSSNYQITHDNTGRVDHQLGLTGSAIDNRFSYGLYQSMGNKNKISNSALSASYQGSKGNISTNYSYSNQSKNLNLTASGGLLVHGDGINFGTTQGETVGLIYAPGALGTETSGGQNRVSSNGYAIFPNLNQYNSNMIGLNVNTLPDDITLANTNVVVYPTTGAVVRADFKTRFGYQVLFNIKNAKGKIPFGAIATLIDKENIDITGIVNDEGQLYMSGMPDSGTLTIKWGTGKNQQCSTLFSAIGKITVNKNNPIRRIELTCQ